MPVSPLQILLLTQLEEGPKYGYEMLKHLKDEFEGSWIPKTGTVYPALRSLEKKEYVRTQKENGTDFYFITEKGRDIFPLLMQHIIESLQFSVKYISVIFKWLSSERKQGAIELMEHLAKTEQALTSSLMKEFVENIDTDIREPFLKQIQLMASRRLQTIDNLMEEK